MAQHINTSEYFSGQGIVMIATKDGTSGDALGFTPIGNVTDLSLSTEISKDEHKESSSGSRAVDLTLSTETNVTFSASLESMSSDNLAYALRGTKAAVAAGSVVAGPGAGTAKLGKIGPTGHIQITSLLITNVAAVLTYVLGDNYTVDEASGSYYLMTTAEQTAASAANLIAEDEVLEVGYSFADQVTTDALTGASEVRWIRFEGLNTAKDNEPVVVDIFKMEADLLSELSLISDEVNSFDLTGTVLSDATRVSGSKHFKVTTLT